MKHIAQNLGISASTVSRALKQDPSISAQVRLKVQEIAQQMGYRPNPLVSALMANRRKRSTDGEAEVIALITNYRGNDDWRSKDVCRWEYEGILQRADALGFRVEVFPLEDYRNDQGRLKATLVARGIRGVLLGFSRQGADIEIFPSEHFAVAGLSAYFRSVVVDRANFHGYFNVKMALEKIVHLGYRRPALIVPDLNNRLSSNSWSAGYLDWQRDRPEADRCELLVPAEGPNMQEFQAWFEANRPDALLVYKVEVLEFLNRLGLQVPKDVGLAYLYRTALEMEGTAGVDGNLGTVGAAALDLVVEKLNANQFGHSPHPKEVLIKGTWLDGASLPRRM